MQPFHRYVITTRSQQYAKLDWGGPTWALLFPWLPSLASNPQNRRPILQKRNRRDCEQLPELKILKIKVYVCGHREHLPIMDRVCEVFQDCFIIQRRWMRMSLYMRIQYSWNTSIKTANQFQYFRKKYVSRNNGVFLLNIQHLTLSTFLYAEYIGSMAEKLRLMVENGQTAPEMRRGAGASIGGNTRSVNESAKGSFNISERVLVSLPGEVTSMWIKSRREHIDCILPLYGNTLLQARAERRYGVRRSLQTARPPRTYLSTWTGLIPIC